MNHEKYMRLALELARDAARQGEVPVGCVIVDGGGAVIGRGQNRREARRCATAHAEMEAIQDACARRGDWRLDDCSLYVTLEPCPMCAGAMINARVGTLVYGAREPYTGSCASVLNLFAENYPAEPKIYAGILAEECAALLSDFFQRLRQSRGVPTFLSSAEEK